MSKADSVIFGLPIVLLGIPTLVWCFYRTVVKLSGGENE